MKHKIFQIPIHSYPLPCMLFNWKVMLHSHRILMAVCGPWLIFCDHTGWCSGFSPMKTPTWWFTNFNVNVLENHVFILVCSLFITVVILTTKKHTKYFVTFARVFPLWRLESTVNQILHILQDIPSIGDTSKFLLWMRMVLSPKCKKNFFKPCNNYDNPCSI